MFKAVIMFEVESATLLQQWTCLRFVTRVYSMMVPCTFISTTTYAIRHKFVCLKHVSYCALDSQYVKQSWLPTFCSKLVILSLTWCQLRKVCHLLQPEVACSVHAHLLEVELCIKMCSSRKGFLSLYIVHLEKHHVEKTEEHQKKHEE